MVVPTILVTTGKQTGWFGIKRLHAEGPYEAILFSEGGQRYKPDEGPLAHTETDTPSIWCAVRHGQLDVAPKTGYTHPPVYDEGMQVRGYYDLDVESNKIVWHPIGKPWDEKEIAEFRVLSNPSYRLYRKVSANPEHIFLFGAGASFGSAGRHLYERGLLPPLGNNLFTKLRDAPELEHWRNVPAEIQELFSTRTFEEALDALEKNDSGVQKSFRRDIELSLFFSRYRPQPSNLYWKLASRIARCLKTRIWTGAAITLNYERLLEESFMRNEVFTVVKGVTFYDDYDDNLPEFRDDQLFEVAYPHGACQFFMSQDWIKGEGDVVFGESSHIVGNAGANHVLKSANIPMACKVRQIPLICRYHPSKRASVGNYFIVIQKERSQELVLNAKMITIVGVQCLHQNDRHIWEPLSKTPAFLVYVEPGHSGQDRFRAWATSCGKVEGKSFRIISETFRDAFDGIAEINDL
jgi:hypothetical protein